MAGNAKLAIEIADLDSDTLRVVGSHSESISVVHQMRNRIMRKMHSSQHLIVTSRHMTWCCHLMGTQVVSDVCQQTHWSKSLEWSCHAWLSRQVADLTTPGKPINDHFDVLWQRNVYLSMITGLTDSAVVQLKTTQYKFRRKFFVSIENIT